MGWYSFCNYQTQGEHTGPSHDDLSDQSYGGVEQLLDIAVTRGGEEVFMVSDCVVCSP